MACCLTAPSHYLSQYLPRSLWPYGVTKPQWVKKVEKFIIYADVCNRKPCGNAIIYTHWLTKDGLDVSINPVLFVPLILILRLNTAPTYRVYAGSFNVMVTTPCHVKKLMRCFASLILSSDVIFWTQRPLTTHPTHPHTCWDGTWLTGVSHTCQRPPHEHDLNMNLLSDWSHSTLASPITGYLSLCMADTDVNYYQNCMLEIHGANILYQSVFLLLLYGTVGNISCDFFTHQTFAWRWDTGLSQQNIR